MKLFYFKAQRVSLAVMPVRKHDSEKCPLSMILTSQNRMNQPQLKLVAMCQLVTDRFELGKYLCIFLSNPEDGGDWIDAG